MSNGFPKRAGVLRGCILAYLVDCIMTAQHALFTRVSWKDDGFFAGKGPAVYGMNDGQGIYGAITFEGELLVGIFYDTHSERSPYRHPETYDLNRFFQGMPSHHRILVDGPLEDFIGNVDGQLIPEVTTAFWDNGDYLTAADPWEVVLNEGARVVRIELMADIDDALAAWQEEYEMSPHQVAFSRLLFDCKMSCPTGIIELSNAEVTWLRSTCEERSAERKEQAISGCRDSLAALGIRFPPVLGLNPACQTPTTVALANAVYDNRNLPDGTLDNARLSVLADALEDAGCNNTEILGHLRSSGPHVRGCWVVDCLTGRE
jgi:hypothetical protein